MLHIPTHSFVKNIVITLSSAIAALFSASCTPESYYLRYALRAAGPNRPQLEAVLDHYRHDPQKLAAARYLISNMPAHYSYADTVSINSYYATALLIMRSDMTPEAQRDTLLEISLRDYPGLSQDIVSDVQVITADYLIYSIDQAFGQWRTRPWASHLTYEEFRDWILPYKGTGLQSLDHWRDTLAAEFSDSILSVPADDVKRLSIYGAIDIVRDEITRDHTPRVLWDAPSGYSLLSASTLKNMTFGSCFEYVNMGVLTFRSLGLPAVVDQVPVWGRNRDGHSWFTFLSDQGRETPTMNSLVVPAGMGFYPYERCPKIMRQTYAINRDRVRYMNTSGLKYPFPLCEVDVTGHYYRTSDPIVRIHRGIRLKERYAYIAMFTHGSDGPRYTVLDYGRIRFHRAKFRNMGRNILYIALGYDGRKLIPISDPFIVQKNGNVRFIGGIADRTDESNEENTESGNIRSIDIRRKYYQSSNVVELRHRLHGSKIQYADRADFSDSVTVWTIGTTEIPDKQPLPDGIGAHRYWRYLGADGSYGAIAELAFFDEDSVRMDGRPVADIRVPADTVRRAFDDGWLTNFESAEGQADDVWVGLDFGTPRSVRYVRVVPRSDDNDVCPGNEYELLWWNSEKCDWTSTGRRTAAGNVLHYDDIPSGTLLWLRNLTRGHDERPFIIDEQGNIEWW